MARDGSGNYSRVEGPYVNGNVADADEINAELDDIGSALSDSINKAGTKAFAADQSMGGFKLTNLAAPASANDAARKAYVDSAITAAAQPLDATLTALAALSWSSGSPVVQFTAADTVSLTLTPSLSSVTASQGAAATTPSGTFVNTNDAAAVQVLRLEGDRATPATNDLIYESYYLSDASGNQDEFARVSVAGTTLTNGAEQGRFIWSVMAGGTLTQKLGLSTNLLFPIANDVLSLGTATLSFADLYLASGGVINWNNGNFTITHSSGLLSFSGAVQSRIPLSSETSGTLTSASANKKVVCTGNITLDDGVFTADDFIVFDPGTSNRTFTRAAGLTMYVNGVDSASATLADNEMGVAHWRSSTVVVLSGAFT